MLWKGMLMELRTGQLSKSPPWRAFAAAQHLGRVLFFGSLAGTPGPLPRAMHSVTMTWADSRLQRPVRVASQVQVPKLLVIFLSGKQTISFAAWLTQGFVLVFLGAAGFLLIAVLSLDQYLAIYKQASVFHNCHEPEHLLPPVHSLLCFGVHRDVWSGGEGVPVLFLRPPSHPLPLLRPWPPDPSLLWLLSLKWMPLPSPGGPLTSLVQHHCASNIVATVLLTPSAKERQVLSLHPLLSPQCLLTYGSCVFIYANQSRRAGWLQQGGGPCEHSGDPTAEPCHLHLRNKQVHQALRKWCSGWKYQAKKSYGLGVEGFRKPFVFIPDTVAVPRAVVGSLWQTCLPDLC